jgi:TP901 family phage tail tape measure protein
MPNTRIEFQIIGLDSLREAVKDVRSYNTAVARTITLQGQLAQSAGTVTQSYRGMSRTQADVLINLTKSNQAILEQISLNTKNIGSINQTVRATDQATTSTRNWLAAMLTYRLASAAFHEVVKSITAAKDAMIGLEYQSARVKRVLPTSQYGTVTPAIQAGATQYGLSIQDTAEGYYQLGTFIKDADERQKAFNATANIVVGTESDMRETVRALIALHAQFGEQMGKNVSEGEQYRRFTELMAVQFKNSNLEVSEMIQSIKYLGPIAQAARVPVEQLFAVLGGLEAAGQRGRMAGTSPAQFISQLIRRNIPGTEDIKAGQYIYKDVIARTESGGMDLVKTLERIIDLAHKMPKQEMVSFLREISGAQNSFRFLGTLEETLPRIKQQVDENTKAVHGLTDEATRLKNIMADTFQVQSARAFNSLLVVIGTSLSELDDRFIHLKGAFRDFANWVDNWAKDKQAIQDVREAMFGGDVYQQAGQRLQLLRRVQSFSQKIGPQSGYPVSWLAQSRALATPEEPRLGLTDPELEALQQMGVIPKGQEWGSYNPAAIPGLISRYQQTYNQRVNTWQVQKDAREAQQRYQAANAARIKSGQAPLIYDPVAGRMRPDINFAGPADVTIRKVLSPEALAKQQRQAEAERNKQATVEENLATEAFARGTKLIRDVREGRIDAAEAMSALAQASEDYEQHRRRAAELRQRPNEAQTSSRAESLKDQFSEAARQRSIEKARERLDIERGRYNRLKENPLASDVQITAQARAVQQAEYGVAAAQMGGAKDRTYLEGAAEARLMNMKLSGTYNQRLIDEANRKREERLQREAEQYEHQRDIELGIGPGLERIDEAAMQRLQRQYSLIKSRREAPGILDEYQKLTGDIQDTQAQIKALKDLHSTSESVTQEIENLEIKLTKLGVAAKDAYNKMGQEELKSALTFEQAVEQSAVENARRTFEESDVPVFGLSRRGQFLYQQQRLRESRTLPNADKARIDFELRYGRQSYEMQNREQYANMASNAAIDLYHQTPVGTVLLRAGNAIIETGLDNAIRGLLDPWVMAANGSTVALRENTNALYNLNSTLTGDSTSVAGPGGGGSSTATGTVTGSKNQALTYARYGLAGYSVLSNSLNQPLTAGSVISGALAGFGVGGPIGAAIGGGLALVGGLFQGLFGHKTYGEPAKGNPALYGAPGDFDYYAYRYRASGILPDMGAIHAMQVNVPVVNVYVDGVKKAVRTEVTRQGAPSAAAMVNAFQDMHSPS